MLPYGDKPNSGMHAIIVMSMTFTWYWKAEDGSLLWTQTGLSRFTFAEALCFNPY